MGSGLKTILLVLLNLMVIPKFEKKEKSNYVFCFEELENNLHPALQRKLFKYIETYARKNNCIFFITTHSNVVIDTFGSSEIAQIIHIKNINGETTVNNISSHKDYKNLLQDLDIKASDLLQSNGIIWVEGPSDRIYINRFINLINPNLIEGVNYSIMYYGGRLLSNLSFDYDAFTDNLIPLLKINHNSFVIMDRDGEKPSTSLNKTKKRISNEIGVDNFWITKGREIENYLHESVIANWLSQKTNEKIDDLNLDNDTKIEISIEKVNPLLKYNKNKTAYSKEIVQHINVEHLDILDLKKKLNILLNTIEKWNNL